MSSGPELLLEWVERRNISKTTAAKTVGVDKSIFTKLTNGMRRAGLKTALRIERATGIPVEAWMSEASDKQRKPRSRKPRKSHADK